MNSYYDALAAEINGDGLGAVDFDITGEVLLDLDGTNYVYTAAFELVLTIVDLGTEGSGDASGTVSGTYEVVDGIITTTLGSSDLTVIVDVGGVTLSGSDLANGLLETVPINNAPFDCEGPTIGFQKSEDPSVRHPVVLTPA